MEYLAQTKKLAVSAANCNSKIKVTSFGSIKKNKTIVSEYEYEANCCVFSIIDFYTYFDGNSVI